MNAGIDFTGITTPFYCNDGNGKFLFAKRGPNCRDEQGAWETGGGRLEFGESPEIGVLREVFEEYGCQGIIQEQAAPFSLVREHQGQKTHWLAIPFFILIKPQEAKLNEPESIDEIGWFGLDQLPSPLHTGFSYALQNLKPLFDKYSQLRS